MCAIKPITDHMREVGDALLEAQKQIAAPIVVARSTAISAISKKARAIRHK